MTALTAEQRLTVESKFRDLANQWAEWGRRQRHLECSAELERIFPALATDGYVVVCPRQRPITASRGPRVNRTAGGSLATAGPFSPVTTLLRRSACSRHLATRSATTTDSKLGASAGSMPTTSAIGRTPPAMAYAGPHPSASTGGSRRGRVVRHRSF